MFDPKNPITQDISYKEAFFFQQIFYNKSIEMLKITGAFNLGNN